MVVMPDKVPDESPCHAELNIVSKMRIVGHEYLRDQRFETRFEDQDVNMRGTVVVPVLGVQEFADHISLDRNGIADRLNTSETKRTRIVSNEFATQVHIRLRWI
jgi:hypothetical protein